MLTTILDPAAGITPFPLKQGPGSISITPAPWDSTKKAFAFSVSDAAMAAKQGMYGTPPAFWLVHTTEPSASLICKPAPNIPHFVEGDDAYLSWEVYFDPSYPKLVAQTSARPAWMLPAELHGPCWLSNPDGSYKTGVASDYQWFARPPFGSPATALNATVINGQEVIGLGRGWPTYDMVAVVPFVRGVLHKFTMHVHFSSTPALGVRELWHNGTPVIFKNGSTKLTNDNTLRQVPQTSAFPQAWWGAREGLFLYTMEYFGKQTYGIDPSKPAKLWHGLTKSGPTYASVQ